MGLLYGSGVQRKGRWLVNGKWERYSTANVNKRPGKDPARLKVTTKSKPAYEKA